MTPMEVQMGGLDLAQMQLILHDSKTTMHRLDEMGISYPKPEGAFYVFPDISEFGMGSEEFCTRMIREARVAAVPGSCFGGEGFIRLSCCCADAELKRGLDRMEFFVKKLRQDS